MKCVSGAIRLFVVLFLLVAPAHQAPAAGCGPAVATLGEARALPRLVKDPTNVVVIGAGDVILKYYSPAFRRLMADYGGPAHVNVTFVDNSRFSLGNPAMMAKRAKVIGDIDAWGGKVLDRNDPAQEEKVRALLPDIVFVATPDHTHAAVAEEVGRLFPGAKVIILEKPVEGCLDAARRLADPSHPLSAKLLALDHTLARLPADPETTRALMGHVGDEIKDFTFYFLEDGSGADPYADKSLARDGAIELAQRVKTLDDGLMLDLMPHVLAVVGYFGKVESIRVLSVERMQYTGVDGNPDKRTEIKGETFAIVRFTFEDHRGHTASATAYVGKGVRGVQALGRRYDHNVKVVEVTGTNGKKERLDLRSKGEGNSTAELTGVDGTIEKILPLNPIPYYALLRGAMTGYPTGTMPISRGTRILETIERMIELGQKQDPVMLAYPGGMAPREGATGRPSLYLEEILRIRREAGPKS